MTRQLFYLNIILGDETAVLSQYCGNQVEYILQGTKADQLTFIQYQALDRFR